LAIYQRLLWGQPFLMGRRISHPYETWSFLRRSTTIHAIPPYGSSRLRRDEGIPSHHTPVWTFRSSTVRLDL
jgi:hypothetical protein